jgi:2',3'-cyclic-nucleotide 2'-phosphodiesterase (5'-nucleotidase family)
MRIQRAIKSRAKFELFLLRLRPFVFVWATLVFGAFCGEKSETAKTDEVKLTFLHINDVHGMLEQQNVQDKFIGGYARLSTYVDACRKSENAARVFFLHAGDEFSRGDALTRATLGEANFTILNHLKLDFFTPGNGDFYDGLKNLQDRIRQAYFRVLAANVRLKSSGETISQAFSIENVGPVKIAFFGLCFVRMNFPPGSELILDDPMETAKKLVPELRKQADFVVALTHIGLSEDKKLIAEVSGIDLLLGGHSHSVLRQGFEQMNPDGKKVMICQAGDLLHYVGKVDVTLKPHEGKWIASEIQARLISLDEEVKLDPVVTALIAKLAAKATQTPVLK